MYCALPTTTSSNVRLRYANRTYNTYRTLAPTASWLLNITHQFIKKSKKPTSEFYPLQSSNPTPLSQEAVMKISTLVCSCVLLVLSSASLAESSGVKKPDNPPPITQSPKAPEMSEIPTMKEQGKRMASLMEKIHEITDPAERKRIMAEAMCPQ